MGSLWQRYTVGRDLRRFQRDQAPVIENLLSAIDDEVRRILNGDLCLKGDLAGSSHFHRYCIGVLDAITSLYERETRKRLGLELYRPTFVSYLYDRFAVARADADSYFTAAASAIAVNPELLRDGYADGLVAFKGALRIDRLRQSLSQPHPANDQEIGFDVVAAAIAAV